MCYLAAFVIIHPKVLAGKPQKHRHQVSFAIWNTFFFSKKGKTCLLFSHRAPSTEGSGHPRSPRAAGWTCWAPPPRMAAPGSAHRVQGCSCRAASSSGTSSGQACSHSIVPAKHNKLISLKNCTETVDSIKNATFAQLVDCFPDFKGHGPTAAIIFWTCTTYSHQGAIESFWIYRLSSLPGWL